MAKDSHTYNLDDFLHTSEARAQARKEFPRIYFSLFSSFVSDEFLRLDEVANEKKKRLQNFGIFAVGLAFLALALAAVDIAFLAPVEDKTKVEKLLATAIPFGAAISGILSFVMGFFGAGVGKRKTEWLCLRMQTELIRQWKARFYLNHRESILNASGSEEDALHYNAEMRDEFREFIDFLKANSDQLFADIVSKDDVYAIPEGLKGFLTRAGTGEISDESSSSAVNEYYLAYTRMRLEGQQNYSRYIATSSGSIRTHPRVQKETVHRFGLYAVFGIVALHVLVTLGVFTGVKELKSVYVHLATVILALTALAFRAVEDGLQPDEHLTRYAGYFASIRHLALRFERARTTKSKHEYAWELEDAAYAEMVDFLKSSDKARFVM